LGRNKTKTILPQQQVINERKYEKVTSDLIDKELQIIRQKIKLNQPDLKLLIFFSEMYNTIFTQVISTLYNMMYSYYVYCFFLTRMFSSSLILFFIQHTDTEESSNYITLHGGRGENDGSDYTLAQSPLEGKFAISYLEIGYEDFYPSSKFIDIETVSVR
jgi:hypothetical protein